MTTGVSDAFCIRDNMLEIKLVSESIEYDLSICRVSLSIRSR